MITIRFFKLLTGAYLGRMAFRPFANANGLPDPGQDSNL